ncbi:MAG: response regulator [Deltaproteobacteria bacterium]|nr:response regulator [Candidatus Zymogenaceae bacterium]
MTNKGAIILIEDDPSVLSAIGRILAREGYDVAGFSDPLKALAALGQSSSAFDLIIIDINLPGIDGFDTSRRLKEIRSLQDVPIIFISAIHTDSDQMLQGLELGAVDYIIKPFDPDIFLKKVENFVRLKQSTERIESLSRRYRLLFEEYSDPTFILDRTGKIIEANTAARKNLDVDTDGPIPDFLDLIHPNDKDDAQRLIGDLTSSAAPAIPHLIRMRDPDGNYRFMEVNGGSFVRETMSTPVHITARDVTERITLTAGLALLYNTSRRLSTALTINEIFPILTESIREAVTADRIGIITIDPEQGAVIRATTRKGTDGFTLPQPIDLSHYPEYKKAVDEKRYLHIEDAGSTPLLFAEERQTGQADTRTLLLIPILMGTRAFGLISLARLGGKRPFLSSEIDVLRSVADLAALSMENARLFGETRKNEEFKSHLINVFTHEVGTPLGTIMGHAQIVMETSRGDAKIQRHLAAVFSESERLKLIMENFLDITRLRSGKIKPRRDEINPHILAQKVFSDFDDQLTEKKIGHRLVLAADNLKIEGDLSLLEGALANLLKNALKYTPAGGSVTVTVSGVGEPVDLPGDGGRPKRRLVDPLVSIAVADTGIGVAHRERERIFEEFYRGKNVPSGEKGAGLGLAIVKETIEAHGGGIRLIAPEEGGSIFEIVLPVRKQMT